MAGQKKKRKRKSFIGRRHKGIWARRYTTPDKISGSTSTTQTNLDVDEIEKIDEESLEVEILTEEYELCDEETMLLDDVTTLSSLTNTNYSTNDHEEVTLDENSILRDTENPSFFIRKLMKNDVSKTGKLKKDERVYNSYQYCGACNKRVLNFSHHINRNYTGHTECQEVQEMINESDAEKKKTLMTLLRGKFNNQFNMNTIKRGHGELILERRPKKCFVMKDFGPCPTCLHWMSKNTFAKHQSACAGVSDGEIPISRLVTRSDTLCVRKEGSASRKSIKEVFAKIKLDDLVKVVRSDPLIIQLGNQLLEKNDENLLKRETYTSQRMRFFGRLLHNLRKEKPLPKGQDFMFQYLKPEHFSALCLATIEAIAPCMDEEELEKPSNANKIRLDIKQLITGKIGQSIMCSDDASRKDAEDLLKIMDIHWETSMRKVARDILEERKFKQDVNLPDSEDIRVLNKSLNSKIKELNLKQTDYNNYKHVCEVLEAKLVLYNSRRTSEVQVVRISDYKKRKMGGNAEHIIGECSSFEKKLLETQEIMTVRGKTGRGLSIILPLDVKEGLHYIANATVRLHAGIDPENRYLFAAKGEGVFRACSSLLSACQSATLCAPVRRTSTSHRKYIATLTQVFDLNLNQLQWVLNHLGDTLDAHKIDYRDISYVLEGTQIAKILLLQDHPKITEFGNRSLDDIQLSDIVFSETSQSNDRPADNKCNGGLQVFIHDTGDNIFQTVDESLQEAETIIPARKKRKKPNFSTRCIWTNAEEQEIKQLFKNCFNNKVRPTPSLCLKAIQKSKQIGGLIQKRERDVLKKKVFRMIDKLHESDTSDKFQESSVVLRVTCSDEGSLSDQEEAGTELKSA